MNKLPTIVKNQIPKEFLESGWKIFNEGKYRHLDFIRNSFTAQFLDKRGSHWATLRKKSDKYNFQTSCSCSAYLRNINCQHLAALFFIVYSKNQDSPDIEQTLYKYYEQSLWIQLAKLYYEHFGDEKLRINVSIKFSPRAPEISLFGLDDRNSEIFQFILPEQYAERIIQKYRWQIFADLEDKNLHWNEHAEALEHLASEKSELEIRMNLSGYKSWQQKFEESYWFDFSKAWFFGFDDIGYSVTYSDQSQSLQIFSGDERFSFHIQKPQIANIIKKLAQNQAIRHTLNIAEKSAVLNYSLEVTNEHDLKITPVLLFPDEKVPCFLTEGSTLSPILFSNYLYVQNKGFFPYERKINYYDSDLFGLQEVRVPNDDIPKIIHEYRRFIDNDEFYFVSPSLKNRDIIKNIKAIDLFVDDIQDDWLYLSVKYRIGNEIISLYEIYQALRSGKRYLIAKNHWIDLFSSDFIWLQKLIETQAIDLEKFGEKEAYLKVNKLNFIKLNVNLPQKARIESDQSLSKTLSYLTELKPMIAAPPLEGRKYTLRDYQKNGYEWFWFLYENRLSGLLCDDMGLGKTYQSLALIDGIILHDHQPMNFLIVSPTSVLPHWHEKLVELKKKVNLNLYYGSERKLINKKKPKYNVVLTSYGILRNDLEKLSELPFEVAIFDEIQTAKNKASLSCG